MADPDEALIEAIAEALDEWLFRMHGLTSSCSHRDEARAAYAAMVAHLGLEKKLEQALQEIVNVLGPEAICSCDKSQDCGLAVEADHALQIARGALGLSQAWGPPEPIEGEVNGD